MRRRVAYLVLLLSMTVFAGLQLNDPDPWRWVTLYLEAAALFGLALAGWYRSWSLGFVIGTYLMVAVDTVPGFVELLLHHPWSDLLAEMGQERQYIEDSRELLGLVIAAASLCWLAGHPPRGGALSAREVAYPAASRDS